MLSYLTILASWPVLTQNNVRRKLQHPFRELALIYHFYSWKSFSLHLQVYFALCNSTLGCAWFCLLPPLKASIQSPCNVVMPFSSKWFVSKNRFTWTLWTQRQFVPHLPAGSKCLLMGISSHAYVITYWFSFPFWTITQFTVQLWSI